MSSAAIQDMQLAQLRTLVAAVLAGCNRFYRAKLDEAGLGGGIESLADFAARCPFTTKAELVADQQSHPPFGSNLTFPVASYSRFNQTSATTGTPLRWLDTPQSWQWMLDNWKQVLAAADVSASDRVFFAFSFGPFLGFWTAFEAAAQMGCLSIPGGGMSSAARLRAILDNRVTVLCCTPTYALRLGEAAGAEGLDLSRSCLRRIIVAGEPGGSLAETRAAIQDAWPGATVFDHHGMTEVGPVSFECPARPGVLHVIESAYLAEVVDPADGRQVPMGQVGELVLTTLGRTGSPLLRYRTGDLVRAGREEPCGCGRHEVVLNGGILGRADDMVLVRGVNVYPTAVDEAVRRTGGIAEYRVHVDRPGAMVELRIEIEPSEPSAAETADALCRQLEHRLREAFNLRVPVSAVLPGTLPRFEMKAKRWVRSGTS